MTGAGYSVFQPSQPDRRAIVEYQSNAAPTSKDSIIDGTIPTSMSVNTAVATIPANDSTKTGTATRRRNSNKMHPTAPPNTATAKAAVAHAGRPVISNWYTSGIWATVSGFACMM